MIGSKISHYTILEKIGEGGMGLVYKAQDTKLNRTVALKFLSSTTVDDVGKKRFYREAHTAASLNHPNIAYVFNIEDHETQSFITMEFVDGRTVQDILRDTGKPLPIKKAIDYAIQIATGLDAAHKKNIIHRDIKSDNIMITPGDRVKIMDFGLAKLTDDTLITQIGTRMGTVAYMSPEQAEGDEVDHRTDLWSLGVVLYEMICGQRPFKGDAEQAVIYSILKEQPPPLTGLRTGVPMELERIVFKAVEKNSAERYQHADEMLADLRVLINRYDEFAVGSQRGRHFRKMILTKANVIIALATITVFALLGRLFWPTPDNLDRQVLRFEIDMPEGSELLTRSYYTSLAISPDGQRIVFPVVRGDKWELYIRNLNESESVPLGQGSLVGMPFFSPDGGSIGFNSHDTLKSVSLNSGVTKIIYTAQNVNFGMADWYDEHSLLLESRNLWKLDTQGGEPELVFQAPKDSMITDVRINSPQMLPGNKAVLATLKSTMEQVGDVVVLHLASGRIDTLVPGARFARYVPTGHLVYASNGDLYALPFNIKSCTTNGRPVRVIENVSMFKSSAQFAFSQSGTLIYAEGGDLEILEQQRNLVMVSRDGTIEKMMLPTGDYNNPRVSPNGQYLSYWRDGRRYVYDFTTARERVITDYEPVGYISTWMPDSKSLIVNSYRDNQIYSELYKISLDDIANPERITWIDSLYKVSYAVTADGENIIYLDFPEIDVETVRLMMLPLTGLSKFQSYPILPKKAITPTLSPNGQWLAYVAEEEERSQMMDKRQVCIRRLFGADRVYKVSGMGCGEPVWSRDGKELYYVEKPSYNSPDKVMVVSIQTEPEFSVGSPRELYTLPASNADWWWTNYCEAPDGERLIWVQENKQKDQTKIKVVYNWFDELTTKVEAAQRSQLKTSVVRAYE